MLDRLTQLRQAIRALDLAAFLVSATPNLRYLLGFSGSNGIGLITSDQCFFVTDWRYREQARHEVRDAEIVIAFRDLLGALKKRYAMPDGARLGFEAHYMNFRMFAQLRKLFSQVKLTATEYVVEKIAVRKSAPEIATIRRAADVSCRVWEQVLPMIQPGVEESDIAAEISYRGRKLGADRDAFEPIVASGWRSAWPHGLSSHKVLAAGEMVVIDFGFAVDGYPADLTRTVALGDPGEQLRRAYQVVLQANELARERIRPGQIGAELDGLVRDFITSQGLGQAFTHSLGHGLGIDVHTLPRIGPTSRDEIPADAVVALEPGVYLAGAGGVRIEDDVLVTVTGCEVLTPIPRELICVA